MHGVGIIGAGPGVEALHLPTLARMAGLRVVHISDAGSGRADVIARRLGARSSTGSDDLISDPAVEVVAICSPPHQHARQILAAVAAGKRAILCEKPLALSSEEVDAVIEACRAAGTALIVGTNHLYDPAWIRAKHHLLASGGDVRGISIVASLPPNDRYHSLVSERPAPSGQAQRPRPDWNDPAVAAAILRQLVLGLAIHDLPAVRDLAPHPPQVVFARPVPPIGYAIGFRAGDVLVQLTAAMVPAGADALWRMSVTTSLDRIDVEFPPAFVHAGSAKVTVRLPDGRATEYAPTPHDGYVEEWRALTGVMSGEDSVEYNELLDDALHAVRLADAVAEAVREGSGG